MIAFQFSAPLFGRFNPTTYGIQYIQIIIFFSLFFSVLFYLVFYFINEGVILNNTIIALTKIIITIIF